MITGSKLSDIWGRAIRLIAGAAMYGPAPSSRPCQSLGVMFFGWSAFETGSCR
jgi:hypothetical protein